MMKLHLLGTGAALSDPHRSTTMLALEHSHSVIVIDCGGDVVQRLMAGGVDLDKIEALILTHEHQDHVSGFPLMMEKLWLAGRREALPVYGIAPALEVARRVHDAFDISDWTGYPELHWHEVPYVANASFFETDTWRVTGSPGIHAVPVMGLRVLNKTSDVRVAYSCDTEPSDAITELAQGAEVLVHEATGEGPGHSSALQAAQVAKRAGVERLLLVHLPPEAQLTETDLKESAQVFPTLEKGEEGGVYDLSGSSRH